MAEEPRHPVAQDRTPPNRDGFDERDARRLALIGGIVLIAILLLVFIIENSDQVEVSFVFFSAEISLIWVIVLSMVAGAVLGFLLSRAVKRRLGRG